MLTSMTLKTTPSEDEGGALGREDALITAVAASTAGWPARVDALRRHQPRGWEGIGERLSHGTLRLEERHAPQAIDFFMPLFCWR